jgi:hypothetical protein
MKQLTLHSDRFPGLGAPVPQVPGGKPGEGGSFTFAVDVPYEVSDDTAAAIAALLESFEPRIQRHFRLSLVDLSTDAVAIAAPVEPEAAPEPVAEPFVLSDDDLELIQVEVEKLKGLTIAQSTPIIENTALNETLPVELRRAYLQAVIDADTSKGVEKKAQELLSILS